ncbi:MAG: alpha/beta fold hydrolase [Chloroflexota bacterium]|nr:alpha/beta fold hydrolase [Chloroflexota bacterium]
MYHPGGPGISAVTELFNSPPGIDFDQHSVLSWDGATSGDGTGACGIDTIKFLTERTPQDFADLGQKAGDECKDGFGSALDVGAWAAADELETIRGALGIDQFDILSISYGTAIAEAYLRWHPEHVRRAVLDAPIGLGLKWADRIAAVGSVSSTLADEMASACDTDRCAAELNGVAPDQSYETLRAAVLAEHPSVGSGNLELSPVVLDQATLLAIHGRDYWPGWATAIDEGLNGDGSALWNAGQHIYLDLDRQIYYRSLCGDLDRPSDAADYNGGPDPLVFAYASDLAPCVRFPSGTPPQQLAAEGAPQPAVEIYVSTRDPLAPSVMLAGAPFLSTLGRYCQSDHPGHTSYADPVARAAIIAFLESGQPDC